MKNTLTEREKGLVSVYEHVADEDMDEYLEEYGDNLYTLWEVRGEEKEALYCASEEELSRYIYTKLWDTIYFETQDMSDDQKEQIYHIYGACKSLYEESKEGGESDEEAKDYAVDEMASIILEKYKIALEEEKAYESFKNLAILNWTTGIYEIFDLGFVRWEVKKSL